MLQMLITDMLKQRVLKYFNNKNLGDYHDLSDTLLLADLFVKLRDKYIEIY